MCSNGLSRLPETSRGGLRDRVMHLVITGGSGYVGTRLLRHALGRGWWVTLLSRRQPPASGGSRLRWFQWELGQAPGPEAFEADGDFPAAIAFIHVAHQWESGPQDLELNRRGSELLIQESRRHGIKSFVFISSFSSREESLNTYGRTKHAVENLLDGDGEVAARVGVIYGGPLKGQWQTLCRITALSPILPMVDAGHLVQAIHLDDLCEGLLRLAESQRHDRKVYCLADSRPLSFGKFLRLIARNVHGRGLLIVSVPLPMVLSTFGIMERLGLPVSGPKERVLGLVGVPVLDTAESLDALGLVLRDLERGLADSAPRRLRRLVNEGAIVLRYLLGAHPRKELLRRYVRGVLRYGNGRPLALPAPVSWWPPLLRIFEPLGRAGEGDLRTRLDMALRLIEPVAEGARLFYDPKGEGVRAITGILVTLVAEALILPLRILLGRMTR